MRKSNTAKALLAGLFLFAPLVSAQQSDPGGSPPASPGQSSSQSGPVSPYDQALQPQAPPQDVQGPISGIEMPRLGRLNLGKSFLIPSLSIQESWDTNSQNAAASASRTNESISTISGRLDMQWMGRKSMLDLGYTGRGFLYDTTSQPHQFLQGLNVNDSILLGRLTLTIGDSFSYVPQSLFGLGGYGFTPGSQVNLPTGNLGTGTTGTTFNPAFLPAQNILGTGRQINNSTLGQAQYKLGALSSLNISASYGLQHFLDPGFIDSHSINVRGGYNFSISARDSVGITYSAGLFRYGDQVSHSTSHTVFLSYQRHISGRLIVTFNGGPLISQSTRLTGLPGMTVITSSRQLSWSVNSNVSYLTSRGNLNVSYSRWNSEGSGLFLGAQSDAVQLSFGRQLTQIWSASVSGNYTRNSSLSNTVTGTSNAAQATGWVAGLSFGRPIGQNLRLGLSYTAARQTSNFTGCLVALGCGNVALRQSIGVGISWSHRPIALE